MHNQQITCLTPEEQQEFNKRRRQRNLMLVGIFGGLSGILYILTLIHL